MKSSWVAPSERVKVCKRCGQNPTLQKRALDMCAECERNLHQDSVDEKGRGGRRAGRKSNRELMRDAERRKEREADRDEVVLEVESGRDKENHRDCLPPIVYPDSMREKEESCFRPRARSSGAKNAAEQPAASSQAGASDDFTVLKSDASDDDEDEEPAQVEIDEEELVADSEQEKEMGEYDANVEKVARDYIEGQSEEDEENSKDDRRVRFDEVSAGRNSNTHLPVDLILRASKITALARGRGNCGIMRQLRDVLTRGLADHSAVVSSKNATVAGAAAPEVDAPESDRPDRASITTEVLMRKPAVELVANPSTRSAAKTTGKTTNQTRAAASKSGKHNRNSDSSSTKGGEHDSTTSTSSSSDEIALVCDGKKSAFAFVHYLQRHFILHRLPFPHSHPNLRLQTYEFAPLSRFDLCVLLDNQLALKTASSRGAGNRQMPDVLGVTGVCVLEQIVGKSSLQLFDPVLGESVQLGSHCAWSAPLKTGDRFCLRSLMRGGGGEGANGMQRFVVMNVASNLCGNSYGGQQQASLRGETGVSSCAAASAGGYSTGPEDASTSAGDTGGATTATEDAVAGEAGSAVTEEDGAPVPVPEGVIISRDHEQDFDTGGRNQTKQRKSAHNKNSARPRQLTKAGGGRQRSSTGASSTAGGASVVVNKSSQLLSSARIVSSKARKFTSHLRYDVVLESEFLQGKIENVICNLPLMVGAGGAAATASAATGEREREGGETGTENETIDAGSVLLGYDLRTRVSNELEELERADRMFPSVVLICRSDASFSSDRSPSASPAKEVCAELAADLTRTLNKL
eukprot:CAMPEP_0179009536 /NCGR_PEP_ID=MMETSP0795-20121207/16324_1 /TAXON_ID=88552 /ORGANISM="Amoebophrya sp., Strain Ameob2" /LENGTH=804 /DNA_ID=CAMNT_0020704739 /DNA_START=251 /DNA_END=2665 /DNA_ORIENTATION=-